MPSVLAVFLGTNKNKHSQEIITKGFLNLQFMQKVVRQKPFLEKAILSSLVNKRYDFGVHRQIQIQPIYKGVA